jgi:NAD+ kinase
MHSEASYPGIPKIILRNSRICKSCSPFENGEVLQKIKSGKYKIEKFWKIAGKVRGKKIIALNDITIHNGDPRHAIRYKFAVNGKQIGHEIIGDGVVVATPFGSTGYYRSITDSFFEVGLGLAFNNSTEQADHMVLREDSKIELEITRGPAVAFADNQEEKITLEVGDKITLEKSAEVAKIVRVDY